MDNSTNDDALCEIDNLQPSKTRVILSWIIVAIIVGVFLPSTPFKFSCAPETLHAVY